MLCHLGSSLRSQSVSPHSIPVLPCLPPALASLTGTSWRRRPSWKGLAAADALAGSSSDPSALEMQEDSRYYVKCELLTQDALQAKMKEMDAFPAWDADAAGSETDLGGWGSGGCDLEPAAAAARGP